MLIAICTLELLVIVNVLVVLYLQRKKSQLAELALHLRSQALDRVFNAVTITDAAGNIKYVNSAFTALTGYTPDEAVGNNPRLLKSGHHDKAFYAKLWAELGAGRPWHGEIVNKKKDGHLFVDEMTITPLKNTEGTFDHYIAVRQDVTERIQQQRRMVEHSEETIILPLVTFLARCARTPEDLYAGAIDLLERLHEFNGHTRAVIFELAPGATFLKMVMTRGDFSKEFLREEATLPLGKCLCGRAAVEGRVLVCENCFKDSRHENQWVGMQVHGHYTIPLKHNDTVLAVINLYTSVGVQNTQRRTLFLSHIGQKLGEALHELRKRETELICN